MKKDSFYKIAIGVLIVLNLLQVGAKFMHDRPTSDPITMPIKQLGLDELQEKQFRELVEGHRKKMREFRIEQSDLTEAYLNQPSDSLLNEITFIESKKIQAAEQHFIMIKKILREDQLDEFEDFKKRTIKRILGFPLPNKPAY